MIIRPTRIFPLGDGALTVELGGELSPDLNDAALAIADQLTQDRFPGFIEAIPAIASATVLYRPHEVDRRGAPTAFDAVREHVLAAIRSTSGERRKKGRSLTVPVRFGSEFSPDLETVAARCGLELERVVEIFLACEYRVFMLGFLPGFPYMGVVDERIAAPRLASPRRSVPKGSVGIAGRQTGIYPAESPGGWQIIGRTDIELFNAGNERPCFFEPGDRVRFTRAS